MKKAIKALAVYSFSLPVVFELTGIIIDPGKTKYISRYSFSFIFEQLVNGALSVIPSVVLLLLVYINVFKKQQSDKHIAAHKMATAITMFYILCSTTLINVLVFLVKYVNLQGKLWKSIAGWGLHPVNAVVFVLLVYGLGLAIGRLIKQRA